MTLITYTKIFSSLYFQDFFRFFHYILILADFILEIIIKGPENVIIYTIFGDNCREIQKYVKIYVVMFVVFPLLIFRLPLQYSVIIHLNLGHFTRGFKNQI